MPVTNVKSAWSSGNLVFYEGAVGRSTTGDVLNVGTAEVAVGNTLQDVDFKVFLGASGTAVFDAGAVGLIFTGADIQLKDSDILAFGTGAGLAGDIQFAFVDGTGLSIVGVATAESLLLGSATYALNTTLHGTLTVGVDDTGYDVQLFGATSGAYLLWDESDDQLEFVGGAQMEMGTSGTPLVLTQGSPVVSVYLTNASTHASNSVVGLYVQHTQTGVGGVGGRAHFYMTTNVALGAWSNALKAEVVYGASGRTTGLGSALLAELQLSAGTTAGTYAPLEVELGIGSGASLGSKTALVYLAGYGADVATFDTSGYLFKLDGLTVGSGKLFQANTAAAASHALRIDIGGTAYYIMLTDTGA